MKSLHEQFLAEVERFLTKAPMAASTFGRKVNGSPNFVYDLRKGRNCGTSTVDAVRDFMKAHK